MATFAAFEATPDVGRGRRLLSTTAVALVVYGLGAVGIYVLVRRQPPPPPEEKKIEVLFQPPAKVEEPPPPPPPPLPKPIVKPVVAQPEPTPEPTPAPPPPRSTGPTGGASGIGVGRTGGGDPTKVAPEGPEPEEPKTVTPPPVRGAPVNLPEDAEPPEPDDGNEPPEYPADARAAGTQAVVILKIVINEKGEVTRVDVLRGDEPFTTAAMSAVKRWHYSPAQLDGKAIAVFKIVKVTFKP